MQLGITRRLQLDVDLKIRVRAVIGTQILYHLQVQLLG